MLTNLGNLFGVWIEPDLGLLGEMKRPYSSSRGAAYFSPGRKSGVEAEQDHAPKGRHGNTIAL